MKVNRFDVVVLGAGVAGLAAAQVLARAGSSVAVVEARDRVGGRVHTLHDSSWPHPVELGAEFLQGLPSKLQLPSVGKLKPRDADGPHFAFSHGRVRPFTREVASGMSLLAQMGEREETAAHFYRRRHLLDTPAGQMSKLFVEGFYAAEPAEVSTGFLSSESAASDSVSGDRMFRATVGYDLLPRTLARGLDVRLSTRVTRVRWKRGQVSVEVTPAFGAPFTVHAPRAVIALPFGVLQHGVALDPAPPLLAAASRALTVGPIVKVLTRWRSAFWGHSRARGFTFVHAFDQPVATWWRPAPFDSNVLVGWAAGPAAAKLTGRPAGRIVRAALRSLEHIFHQPALGACLESVRVADWAADPYARGGYLVVPAGETSLQLALAAPVEGTLFFAGEHTETSGHAGTVHGALWTGRRAAHQLLEA